MTFNEQAFLKNKEQGYRFFQPDSIPSSYINTPRLSRDVYGGSLSRDDFPASKKLGAFFALLAFLIIASVAMTFL